LTGVMRRLADGELDVAIPSAKGNDETSEMARAIVVFRDHMAAESRLSADRAAEQQRAEQEKRAALVGMADTVEQETKAALGQIHDRTAAMKKIADAMSASAERTGEAAESVATAAAEALATGQTVASAAEQLAASIREIGGQVSQSSDVVARA